MHIDVLTPRRSISIDIPAAAQTEFGHPCRVDPVEIVQWDSIIPTCKPCCVQCPAVSRVIIFVVITGLHRIMRVGRLPVLNGDVEIRGRVIIFLIEGECGVVKVRVGG
jgi:hypothetical protein